MSGKYWQMYKGQTSYDDDLDEEEKDLVSKMDVRQTENPYQPSDVSGRRKKRSLKRKKLVKLMKELQRERQKMKTTTTTTPRTTVDNKKGAVIIAFKVIKSFSPSYINTSFVS